MSGFFKNQAGERSASIERSLKLQPCGFGDRL
jgi:hypothetical protein